MEKPVYLSAFCEADPTICWLSLWGIWQLCGKVPDFALLLCNSSFLPVPSASCPSLPPCLALKASVPVTTGAYRKNTVELQIVGIFYSQPEHCFHQLVSAPMGGSIMTPSLRYPHPSFWYRPAISSGMTEPHQDSPDFQYPLVFRESSPPIWAHTF